MATQPKWQSLPTEQINPATLAIDKAPVRDILDLVINEDRKVIAAVQKEKEKIAHGIEIITQALRKGGRVIFIDAGTSARLGVVEAAELPRAVHHLLNEWTTWRGEIRLDAANVRHAAADRARDYGRRTGRRVPSQERRRGQLRRRRTQHRPPPPLQPRRRHLRLRQRHH